ncbi:MAG: tRNA-dihydrouridine synthase family protein [Planctomycetes bacterium]|nr:tRNA-dihydrouridine synthase family protein [Planctomycetota bacterium]
MSCEAANNNATPPSPAIAPGAELIDVRQAAAEIGARGIDPRIARLVPGFDAPFFQAGLAGYSDAAMRIVARRHGCPFCVTEALLDRTLLAGGRGFDKADLGDLHDNIPGGPEDHPLAGQIMGSEPAEMAAAAIKMIEQKARTDKQYRLLAYRGALAPGVNPPDTEGISEQLRAMREHVRLPGGQQVGFWPPEKDLRDAGLAAALAAEQPESPASPAQASFEVIDVNLACPVKKIERKARGGHWLAEPLGAIKILEAVREAVPANIPCAVKMRRSFDDTPEMAANFERIFDAAMRMGYAWATVHARTVKQKYMGPSRWEALRDLVRRHPNAIVFGSGDVWEVSDIFRMIAYTGVHAVSVARGCIGNPWIFRQAREMMAGRPPAPPTIAEQRAALTEHFRLSLAVTHRFRHGEETTSKMMRKFGIKFAQHHPRRDDIKRRMIGVSSAADWWSVVDEFYPAG